MLRLRTVLVAFLVSLASVGTAYAASIPIANAGFELPSTGGGILYTPDLTSQGGTGWTFGGNAGVAANSSAFTVVGATGNQAGFLQHAGASFSQSLTFNDGWYQLSFIAEGRATPGIVGSNPFEVFVGATQLTFSGNGTVVPVAGFNFDEFLSDPFYVAGGAATLSFVGTGVPGFPTAEATSFVDDVAIESVPEPSTLLLLGGGLVAAGVVRHRRRQR